MTARRILITGVCGFVGSTLARTWAEREPRHRLIGMDSFVRPGSETNRRALRELGIDVRHGDIRQASDVDAMPAADWVVDAAANPSVLAGVDDRTSSRQLLEHNLLGTVNLLEYCKRHGAGLILLSTSRVYSTAALLRIQVTARQDAFEPVADQHIPGLHPTGIGEAFSTEPPVSLYGAAKLASEAVALEYADAFGFPVWVNRCGVLAGATQFGRADQGIISYWIRSWMQGRPLRYLGFDGRGHQVRDCLHPRDLVPLLERQMSAADRGDRPRVVNVSGGTGSSFSLRTLSGWCESRFGPRTVEHVGGSRPYDVPWIVLDSTLAQSTWDWRPATSREDIFAEIADHAVGHPDWLDVSHA